MSSDETLAAVSDREALLRALVDGPVEKRTLAERVDASRSTVDRGLRRLEANGLVERSDAGYRQTTLGRQLLGEYDRYIHRAASVLEARSLLEALPPGSDVPTALLVDATVIGAQPNEPYAPLEEGMAAVASADHVRSIVNSGLTRYAELFDDGLLPADGGAELCLPESSFRALLNDRPEWFERAIERPDVELVEAPADPPYTLAVVSHNDTRSVVFGVFDNRGVGSGLVNSSPEAVSWAESVHEDWWAESVVVSAAER